MNFFNENGEDKAFEAQLLKCHQKRCKKECDNFEGNHLICDYYQAEYGYFNYCFMLEHGIKEIEMGEK